MLLSKSKVLLRTFLEMKALLGRVLLRTFLEMKALLGKALPERA